MRHIVTSPSTHFPFAPMIRNECESPHHWMVLWVGVLRLTASCLLAEYHHTQARLKFDEAARDLEKLESSTRKEVCRAVKAFNRNQVYTLRGSKTRSLMSPALTEGSPQDRGR